MVTIGTPQQGVAKRAIATASRPAFIFQSSPSDRSSLRCLKSYTCMERENRFRGSARVSAGRSPLIVDAVHGSDINQPASQIKQYRTGGMCLTRNIVGRCLGGLSAFL